MNLTERPECISASLPGSTRLSFTEFVGLVAALMALTALSIDIMLPALPEIGASLGVTQENDRQLIVTMYMAGFAVGQIFFGPLSDHYGRKPMLLSGLAVFIAGTISALLSGSFALLLASRLVQGVGAAAPRIIAIAVVRDLYGGREMARVISFAMMIFIIIPVVAPSVGQALVHAGNWHWTFYVLLSMGAAAAAWSALRLPETAGPALGLEGAMTVRQSLLTALLDRQTMAYGIAGGFMFGCLLAYVASAQQVFTEVFGTGTAFPLFFGAIASAIALASFINARLVVRLGMRRLSHTALSAFIALALVLVSAATAHAATVHLFAALVAAEFFLFGMIAPNFNAIAMEPQGHNAGMASSLIGALSTAIGAVAGGLVARAFDGTVLPIAIGFTACSLTAFLIVLFVEGRAGLFGRNRLA